LKGRIDQTVPSKNLQDISTKDVFIKLIRNIEKQNHIKSGVNIFDVSTDSLIINMFNIFRMEELIPIGMNFDKFRYFINEYAKNTHIINEYFPRDFLCEVNGLLINKDNITSNKWSMFFKAKLRTANLSYNSSKLFKEYKTVASEIDGFIKEIFEF
jgi:hypothetical protein